MRLQASNIRKKPSTINNFSDIGFVGMIYYFWQYYWLKLVTNRTHLYWKNGAFYITRIQESIVVFSFTARDSICSPGSPKTIFSAESHARHEKKKHLQRSLMISVDRQTESNCLNLWTDRLLYIDGGGARARVRPHSRTHFSRHVYSKGAYANQDDWTRKNIHSGTTRLAGARVIIVGGVVHIWTECVRVLYCTSWSSKPCK